MWFKKTATTSSNAKFGKSSNPISSNLTPAIINNIPPSTTKNKLISESASTISKAAKAINKETTTTTVATATSNNIATATPPHPLLNDVYKLMREGIVSSIFFLILMLFSHFIIRRYIRKKDDEKKIYIPRFLCTVCLSISIAAMLLIPITIISNEIMTTFPSSYYTQWLDRELIFSFWNKIFWGANISLFIILPFTYFLYESEGLGGKSLLNRIKEALLVLLLVAVIFVGFIFIIFKLFYGQQKQPSTIMENFSIISTDYLPFSYSLISTFGTVVVMWAIPSGFNFLITKCISLRIVRPVDDEIKAAKMEIESITYNLEKAEAAGFVNLKSKKSRLKKRLLSSASKNNSMNNNNNNNGNNNNSNINNNGSSNCNIENEKNSKKDNNSGNNSNGLLKNSDKMNSINVNNGDIISYSSLPLPKSPSISSLSSLSPSLSSSPSSSLPQNISANAIDTASNIAIMSDKLSNNNNDNIPPPQLNILDLNYNNNNNNNNNNLEKEQQYHLNHHNNNGNNIKKIIKPNNNFKITQEELQKLEDTRDELYLYIDKISKPNYFSSNIVRILASILLTSINFSIIGWIIFKVFITLIKRIFELFELEQIKSYVDILVSSAIDLSKGSSKLGPFESLFETTIIIYLMIAAFVGFLNEPFFSKIKPRIHSTSLRKMIINTGIILLMSSSFPVVVRILEISRFDLMGYYTHTNYLRNDVFKIIYRISFLFIVARSYTAGFRSNGVGGNSGSGNIGVCSSFGEGGDIIITRLTKIIPSFILNRVLSNSTRNKILQRQQIDLQKELLLKQQLELQQQTNVVKSIQSLVLESHKDHDSTTNPSSSLFSIIAKNQNFNIDENSNSNSATISSSGGGSSNINNVGGTPLSSSSSSSSSSLSSSSTPIVESGIITVNNNLNTTSAPSSPLLKKSLTTTTTTTKTNSPTKSLKNKNKLFFF